MLNYEKPRAVLSLCITSYKFQNLSVLIDTSLDDFSCLEAELHPFFSTLDIFLIENYIKLGLQTSTCFALHQWRFSACSAFSLSIFSLGTFPLLNNHKTSQPEGSHQTGMYKHSQKIVVQREKEHLLQRFRGVTSVTKVRCSNLK